MYDNMVNEERKYIMPKIMNFQDVLSSNGPLICEFRWGVETQHFEKEDILRWIGQGRKYGYSWRCWTEMPTLELQEDMRWVLQ